VLAVYRSHSNRRTSLSTGTTKYSRGYTRVSTNWDWRKSERTVFCSASRNTLRVVRVMSKVTRSGRIGRPRGCVPQHSGTAEQDSIVRRSVAVSLTWPPLHRYDSQRARRREDNPQS